MAKTMSNIKDLIEKKRKNSKRAKYKVLDEDVLVLSGSYEGLTFTDIEVFNSGYIDYMAVCMKVDEGVRLVAKMIQEDRKRFGDNIEREIALGGS